MSNPKPLTDQSGRPVGMVVTPEGARIEVLGDPLPPSQRGDAVYVDPNGGGRPHGDFPVKNPNSGPTAKQKKPAPKTITPIDNNTLGRVYTMGLPPPQQTDAEPTEPPPPGYLERSGEVLKGYGEGLVELPIEAVKMAAEGWKNIVTEPVDTGKALLWGAGELGELGGMALDGWRQIVSDPGQAFDAFVWAAKEGLAQANEILAGDSRDAGKLVGEAVSVVLPTGVAKAKPKPKPKPAPTSGVTILPRSGRKVLGSMSKEDLARWFRENHGITDQAKLDDMLASTEFSQPVRLVELQPGTEIIQYVREGRPVGTFFAYPGTPADTLAITMEGRQLTPFVVRQPIQAIESVAAPYPLGKYPGVGGSGGGTQLIFPKGSNASTAPIK
jgi:hypothetical protein